MERAMKQSSHQFYKTFYHISKCLACNAEKTRQLKIKKRMNIATLEIHEAIYVTRMTQIKWIQ